MMRTTFIKAVYPQTFKSGTRYGVVFHDGTMADTWDDLKGHLLASIAERACLRDRAVRIGTYDKNGQHILTWVEEVAEGGAA